MPKGKIGPGATLFLYTVAGIIDLLQFISFGILGIIFTPIAAWAIFIILGHTGFKPLQRGTKAMNLGRTLIQSVLPGAAMLFPWWSYVSLCIAQDKLEALMPLLLEAISQQVKIETMIEAANKSRVAANDNASPLVAANDNAPAAQKMAA